MRTRRREEKGIALVAVLIVMVLLMAIGGALHTGVISETILRGAHARATSGFYAAEAGINRGIGEYRNIFLSWSVPSGADFDEKTFALGDRTIKYQMTQVGAPNQTVIVPAGRHFAGLNAIRNVYVADSTSELNTGDVEANLGTEFDVDVISLFQFLAFYTGDLEILPGPIMQLNGPIHTNGSLYLNSGNILSIAEAPPPAIPTVNISAAGSIFRRRKDDPAACGGTVSIASLQDANGDDILDRINMPCAGNQTDAQLSVWLGSIRARQPVLAVPNPSILARGAGQYWTGADLRIVLNLDRPDAFGRFPIEAQLANGAVDPVANASLQAFMNTYPGVIFYNDRPRPGEDQDLPCGNGNSYCRFDNYTPSLPDANHVYACSRSVLGLYPAADCPFTVVNEVHTHHRYADGPEGWLLQQPRAAVGLHAERQHARPPLVEPLRTDGGPALRPRRQHRRRRRRLPLGAGPGLHRRDPVAPLRRARLRLAEPRLPGHGRPDRPHRGERPGGVRRGRLQRRQRRHPVGRRRRSWATRSTCSRTTGGAATPSICPTTRTARATARAGSRSPIGRPGTPPSGGPVSRTAPTSTRPSSAAST